MQKSNKMKKKKLNQSLSNVGKFDMVAMRWAVEKLNQFLVIYFCAMFVSYKDNKKIWPNFSFSFPDGWQMEGWCYITFFCLLCNIKKNFPSGHPE